MKRTHRSASVLAVPIAALIGLAQSSDTAEAGEAQNAGAAQPQVITVINEAAQTKGIFTFDYGAPTSPALQLISSSPSKFTTSTSLKPYVFSLPTNWGGSKGADSFAFDFAPAWLLDKDKTYAHYEIIAKQSLLDQLATRTRLSGALNLGSSGNGDKSKQSPSKAGFGISTSLFEDSDPALTPDPTDASQTYWDDCIADLRKTVGAKYEMLLDTKWGAALRIMAQLSAAIDDATKIQKLAKDSRTPAIDPTDAQLIYRYIGDCLNDSSCGTLDSDGKLKSLHDQARPVMRVGAEQLSDVQTTASKMQKALDAANGLLVSDFTSQINLCISNTNLLAMHARALDIGFGVLWQGQPERVAGLSRAAGVVWLGGRYPLSSIFIPSGKMSELNYLMLGGSARASWDEISATGDKTTPQIRANILNAWGGVERVALGSQFSAQIGYQDVHATSSADSAFSKSGMRWLVSGSLKLGDTIEGLFATLLSDFGQDPQLKNGFWLNVSYGTANGSVSSLKDKVLMVSFSFSETPSNIFNASAQ